MSANLNPICVVGAGPTGLAAALFLTERGIPVRILDQGAGPVFLSKAFGVNARTLSLLRSTGVTDMILAEGWRMECVSFHRHGRIMFQVDFAGHKHPFPYITVLPQSRSEALLANALAERGIQVEWNTTLKSAKLAGDKVEFTLLKPDGSTEDCTAPALLGADGAHSTVRAHIGVDFPGKTFPEAWKLADLELETSLAPDRAHLFFFDDGGMFVLRLYDNVWRVIGSVHDGIDRLPSGSKPGNIRWQSDFHIAHRVVARMSHGNIFLAGDAAHLHSPVGGRGMNLGIEDAYVFAELASQNRLQEYDRLRRPVVQKVVRQVAFGTEMPRGKTWFSKAARIFAPTFPLVAPIAIPQFRKFILGLDHELDIERK